MSALPKASGEYRTFRVEPLCGAGGAELSGVDASKSLSPRRSRNCAARWPNIA